MVSERVEMDQDCLINLLLILLMCLAIDAHSDIYTLHIQVATLATKSTMHSFASMAWSGRTGGRTPRAGRSRPFR